MGTFRGSGTPISGADVYDQDALDAAVTDATAQASASAASATAASTSAAAAALSEINAATSETNAAASEAAAATSETNAAASEAAAATSETNAAASEAAAALSYDSFDDRYLGPKASDPTLDNDGNALLTGALYWNTTSGNMMVYDGAAWQMLEAFPSISGNALKHLRVTAGATGLEWFDLLGTANTWTAYQAIQDAYPALRIRDTVAGITTGGLWALNVGASTFSVRQNTAAGGDFSTANVPFAIDASASALQLSSWGAQFGASLQVTGSGVPTSGAGVELSSSSGNGYLQTYDRGGSTWMDFITYHKNIDFRPQSGGVVSINGSAVPAVGTVNTFTAAQQFQAGVSINCNGGGTTQAYLPGDTKLYDFNNTAVAYLTATPYGGGSTSITLKLRNFNAGVANVVFNAAPSAKSLDLSSTNYAYNSESQLTYTGRVASTGASVRLPSGWSCSKTATGTYRVTHTIGVTNFSPLVTPYNNSVTGCRIVTITSTYFDVEIYNGTTLTDSYFHFMCQVW